MNFQEQVREVLEPIFSKHGFTTMVDENGRGTMINFSSEEIEVRFIYDKYEGSYRADINTSKRHLAEITNDLIKNVFNSQLKVSPGGLEEFLNNLKQFFENEGIKILQKDANIFQKIDEYQREKDRVYTENIIKRQRT